jgi:hypothetical protein
LGGDESARSVAGRKLVERFWAAIRARDSAAPGTPAHERASRDADRLARLMVDFDVRGEVPSDEALEGLDERDPPGEGVG